MRTLDRYLLRESLPPFLIALALFTFVLAVNPALDYAKQLLAKGVPVTTAAFLLLTLIPQALSLTVPMAFLTGVLVALGRLSADREAVALLACGVSPLRLLRPVLMLALLVAALDWYVLARVKPDANQLFREITFRHLTEQTASEIRPRVFFEQFPGLVLFVGGTAATGWSDVLLAETGSRERPAITLADHGTLVVDADKRSVHLVLRGAARVAPGEADARLYTVSRQDLLTIRVTAESVFGSGDVAYPRGFAEMTADDLRAAVTDKLARGVSPHNEILHLEQIYAFPAACLVFAVLAIPLGLNTRKEGRLAGFVFGIAVIAAYYVLMQVAEAVVKGEAARHGPGGWTMPLAFTARWVPNGVLGLAGVLALWWRQRGPVSGLRVSVPRWLAIRRSSDPSRSPAARPSAVPDRPVVVLRMPQIPLPLPRLLDRYVVGRFVRVLLLAGAGLLLISYISAIVDVAEKTLKGQASWAQVAAYLWYSTPQFVAWMLPVAVLVGVLATIGGLTRSGELIIMRACGVSLYRTGIPLLLVAAALGAVLFGLEDRVLGEANKRAAALRNQIRDRTAPALSVASHNWLVGEDGRVYYYAAFEAADRRPDGRPTLHGLSVFEVARAPYRLTRHTYAARASFAGGAWQVHDGWTQTFADQASVRQELTSATMPLPPVADFQRAQVNAAGMTYAELREYVRRLGASGFSVTEPLVDLHRKLAFPAVPVVMALLALPFGVTTGRKGALYGIGLAVLLAAGYYLMMTVFLAAGAAGVLPAMLAAWAANLVYAAGALVLTLSVRT